ncbi:MAG: TIGR00730 family Rossman fold protein [Oscillospiraceae bacterium]|nr:TIGR00730 family Rossman fold protein [Oscillospiraceae bacterium]
MEICVFGASSSTIDKTYIDKVEELGQKMAGRGHGLIYGAGASGLMGAAARGAYEKQGKIVGVVPDFFETEDMGVDGKIFDKCTELIKTDSMRERKRIMEDMADAFIVVPGGIGTFEEFFEVFTLKQLERHNKAIVILNINGYYDAMIKMLDTAVEHKFLRSACRQLYEVCFDVDAALDYIENYKAQKINVFEMKNIENGN